MRHDRQEADEPQDLSTPKGLSTALGAGVTDSWTAGLGGVVAEQFGLTVLRLDQLSDGYLNQTWRLHCVDHDRMLRVGRRARTVERVRDERRVASTWAATVPQVVVAESVYVPVVDGRTR